MTYRFVRVVGPQEPDGISPGVAVSPGFAEPGVPQWREHGPVEVLSANEYVPVVGRIYPGRGHAWAVVIRPQPPSEPASNKGT